MELKKAIKLVVNFFGYKWLEKQRNIRNRKPKKAHKKFSHHLMPRPHPILNLYQKATENAKLLKERPNIGLIRESLELISISDVLRESRKIEILNMNGDKVAIKTWGKFRGRLKEKESFQQALYELQIATAFRKSGYRVFFIKEEERRRTPDLSVVGEDGPIYVECKFASETKRERLYRVMFNEFYTRIMRVMTKLGRNYFVCVEWISDPKINDVVLLVGRLEKLLKESGKEYVETKNAKIWLRELAPKDEVLEGPYDVDLGAYLSDEEHGDIIQSFSQVGIFDGKVKHKNPRTVMFRNFSYLDDKVNAIINLLNKSYAQIPRKGPGIVFLETHMSPENWATKKYFVRMQQKLIGKLNLIGRINAVILTNSRFVERKERIQNRDATIITRIVEQTRIWNENPTSEISQDTLKRTSSLKYY